MFVHAYIQGTLLHMYGSLYRPVSYIYGGTLLRMHMRLYYMCMDLFLMYTCSVSHFCVYTSRVHFHWSVLHMYGFLSK